MMPLFLLDRKSIVSFWLAKVLFGEIESLACEQISFAGIFVYVKNAFDNFFYLKIGFQLNNYVTTVWKVGRRMFC